MQKTHSYIFILIAIFLGIVTSVSQIDFFIKTAEIVSTVFINFLKLIAAPIVFLSIFSTFLGMNGFKETKILGKRIVTYTVLTTLISALVALSLFLIFDPVKGSIQSENIVTSMQEGSYISFLLNIVPSNLIQAFLENNVIGIAFVAFILGIASFKLSENVKKPLASFFSSLFQLVLKVTELVVLLLPIAIWAFTTILVKELKANSSQFNGLIIYLGVVLGANLIQGFIVLPILLKMKGLSPLKIAKGGSKALLLAFFTKSSNATLPVTLQCAETKLGIHPKVANFSFPLCTVINMNGCAAFILTTVLFVSGINGHIFSFSDLIMWIFLASLAAIGNAGVPMGCFFLSSAFLVSMKVPIAVMGLILPFYTFLDMVETSLNLWSDISITSIVNKEVKESLYKKEVSLVDQ